MSREVIEDLEEAEEQLGFALISLWNAETAVELGGMAKAFKWHVRVAQAILRHFSKRVGKEIKRLNNA
jgi:hypothetical protein